MIEIDDAGGGCFIGPEVLVIHNLQTGQAEYRLIPPEVVDRVGYATRVLKTALKEMAVTKEQSLRLCRGEIFDPLELHLTRDGYHVIREKVSAATDSLAESKFMAILYSYGLPPNLTLENRDYHRLYELIGCWYFCQPKKAVIRLQKARLRPPSFPRLMARKFPNLLRLMLEEKGQWVG